MTKNSLILSAAIAAATVGSTAAQAEITGNIGFASNYIWRGMTQTVDQSAISGGVDWGHESGLYAGTWVSNVDFSGTGDGYEMDFYVGFAGESGDIGYDVGVATYAYPVTPNFNFTELYVTGSFSMITAGLYLTVDNASGNTGGIFVEDDLYLSISADVTDNISIYAGTYMFDNDGTGATGVGEADYMNYGASYSMGDFAFALDKNNAESSFYGPTADNMRASVTWSKGFEL